MSVITNGGKTHFALSAAEYETVRSGHLERRRHEIVHQMLRSRQRTVRNVLEIGFGSGKLLAELAMTFPKLNFIGIEVERKMVAFAREYYSLPNARYDLADISHDRAIPGCEFVYSIDVIHHIHEPERFFAAVRAVLSTGGVWLAIEPNIYHPYIFYQQERMRRSGVDEDHFRPWRIAPIIRRSGFAIKGRRFVFMFPGWMRTIPAPLASLERRCERFRLVGGSAVYLLQAE